RQVGAAPVTVLPTPTIRTHLPLGKGSDDVTCPSERGTQHARARPRTSPLWGPGLPRAPGPSSVNARTPTRGSETVPRHYNLEAKIWMNHGRRRMGMGGAGNLKICHRYQWSSPRCPPY